MKPAPPPLDETQRLAALRSYGVLDTPPDPALDDLVLLAAQICETPIALISLLDEDRQWFAARVGMDAAETPRDVSFCEHALAGHDLLIVPDAMKDDRFARNPTVTGQPGIRFYAGAPLTTPEGAVLGALCVIDRVPRALTAAREQALRTLSRQVMAQLELRRRTSVLTASEARNRALFEHAPDGILITDPGNVFLDANPSMCRMLGYRREELIGLHGRDIVSAEEIPGIDPALAVIKAGDDYQREWRLRRKDGSFFPAEVIARQMPDGNLLAMARDITERREAEDASRRLAAIVESSHDAIIGKDLNSVVTSWNRGAELIYGYAAAEMIGTSIMRLIPADRQDEERQLMEQLQQGRKVKYFETLRQTKDGRLIEVAVTASPILDETGQVTGSANVGRDVTELKIREREIARLSRLYAALSHVNQAIVRFATRGAGQKSYFKQQPMMRSGSIGVLWRDVGL